MSREVPPGEVPGGDSSSIQLAAQQGNHRREVQECGNATVGTEGVTQDAAPDPLRQPLISGAQGSDIEEGAVDADQSEEDEEEQSEALDEIRNILWIKGVPESPQTIFKEALELWKAKEDLFTARIDRKNKQSSDFQNEVYQLVGFYSVFQGVLLTAVAQSTLLHCNNTWTATLLSALVSFVTVIGVFLKFWSIWTLKNTIGDEEATRRSTSRDILCWRREVISTVDEDGQSAAESHLKPSLTSQALVSWQLRLREMREFDFNKHAERTAANSKKTSWWLIVSFCAVEVVLIIFSIAFVASIQQILCNPGHSLLP